MQVQQADPGFTLTLNPNPNLNPFPNPAGTKDLHHLLPMQVHQADPGDQALRATDGRMMATILANPSYTTVSEARAVMGVEVLLAGSLWMSS